MPDTAKPADAAAPAANVPPKRHPGHRGQDVRDTVAEMAAKAHEISLEAGSKMAAAMKEVVGAAAGLSAFAIESARDLVQYMVRRGQMTQDEADKLIREAEEAWLKQNKGKPLPKMSPPPTSTASRSPMPSAPKPAPMVAAKPAAKPMAKAAPAKKAAAPAKKPAPAKKAPAAKKPAAKKPAPKK
jgi:polyhydroxyalkanoate synthesis regulator phasin